MLICCIMPYPQHNSHYGCCNKSHHEQKQEVKTYLARQCQRGLNYCYCPVIQQAIWTNYHRYPIQISIRHVKTCASDLSCDFTLFLVGPFSGKQIPAPATVFNTHYFMPGAKSLISLIHFLFSTHYFFNYQGAVQLCFHPAAATI